MKKIRSWGVVYNDLVFKVSPCSRKVFHKNSIEECAMLSK
jgi:hypothetical protein